MRTFPMRPRCVQLIFLKPITFQIVRDSIKRNNFITIIVFIVLPKHNGNV